MALVFSFHCYIITYSWIHSFYKVWDKIQAYFLHHPRTKKDNYVINYTICHSIIRVKSLDDFIWRCGFFKRTFGFDSWKVFPKNMIVIDLFESKTDAITLETCALSYDVSIEDVLYHHIHLYCHNFLFQDHKSLQKTQQILKYFHS